MKRTTVLVHDDDVVALKHLSERLDLSEAQMMRRAITQYVADKLTVSDLDAIADEVCDPSRWEMCRDAR